MSRIAERPQDSIGHPAASSELEIDDRNIFTSLVGHRHDKLKVIEREARVTLGVRGNKILLRGLAEEVALVERFLMEAASLCREGVELQPSDVVGALQTLREDPQARLQDVFDDVPLGSGRRNIRPRGFAQKRYIEAIRNHDLTFGIGPAGTGKTYLAVACGVAALIAREVKRIVLTRPAVEAGERLGFLPGDLAEKVDPYLRPLYDALNDMMDVDKAKGLLHRGQVEVAPLAFMRGRTLNDSFVILDEAQNTTSEQMHMFLTRLGNNAKAVVTGDVTQVDLPEGRVSGLAEARDLLRGIEGIEFCEFSEVDVVRHPLVKKIIARYERRDRERGA